ncbi:unnamed protein product [Ophioblennius macclurei]
MDVVKDDEFLLMNERPS